MGPDSLYFGKWGKLLNAYSDLDLGPTKLNIELVRASYATMYSNFVFLDGFLFELSCKNTHTQIQILITRTV